MNRQEAEDCVQSMTNYLVGLRACEPYEGIEEHIGIAEAKLAACETALRKAEEAGENAEQHDA